MGRKPANSADTITAVQWRPSPSSSMCSQGRPAAMRERSSSAVMARLSSAADLVADAQQVHGDPADGQHGGADDREAEPGRYVADAEEAVAEAVDHVEKGIQVRDTLP